MRIGSGFDNHEKGDVRSMLFGVEDVQGLPLRAKMVISDPSDYSLEEHEVHKGAPKGTRVHDINKICRRSIS